ncbi:hypothetical protein H072_7165 [Dactylellina haptotyla CBS 200.50]|uniref:Uncharacterized protein n=1 Tax=Dactylellina haptotyla (strain CBS 200.50) TaxID=1284197 RepID=S8A7T6_DACHA|nr:hypothetical protein H072_7165 [Dactylellina haptotyla CBS 200.50]
MLTAFRHTSPMTKARLLSTLYSSHRIRSQTTIRTIFPATRNPRPSSIQNRPTIQAPLQIVQSSRAIDTFTRATSYRNYQNAAAFGVAEDIIEIRAAVIVPESTTGPIYVPQFANLAERLIADFKISEIHLTSYGAETIRTLYNDLADQSITRDLVDIMDRRLSEFEKARKASGRKDITLWIAANEPHTCGARFHTDSLRGLKNHPRGMWEALEDDIKQFGYDHWSMKVYWFLADLIKADIIQRRELLEYHGDPEDEHLWGASRVKWRRLL